MGTTATWPAFPGGHCDVTRAISKRTSRHAVDYAGGDRAMLTPFFRQWLRRC